MFISLFSIGLSINALLFFNLYYSKDSLAYVIFNDKNQWHKHTWYYEDYTWINNNIVLNHNQQIMVYAYHQQTNYLRKRYINIDSLSGYFKDEQIFNSSYNYINELKKYNIAYVFIDIDAATGNTVTPQSASNYKLIYKSCASCNFSVESSGENISNDDWIKFENVSLKDVYYAISSTDTNL